MSVFLFLPLLFGYIGLEAWAASRREVQPGDPMAAAWAWRTAILAIGAASVQFGWPVVLF